VLERIDQYTIATITPSESLKLRGPIGSYQQLDFGFLEEPPHQFRSQAELHAWVEADPKRVEKFRQLARVLLEQARQEIAALDKRPCVEKLIWSLRAIRDQKDR
jgi:hypothetical protein